MLGPTMAYTCGYWQDTDDLDQAQINKYDLVCRKLHLRPGEHLLDMGCGFCGFSKFAAENYGVRVTAVNISIEQMKYAVASCQGLPIDFVRCDYRDVAAYNPNGAQFDKIASIGLCEHIGYKNYHAFMSCARQQLKEDGLFLLHTIGKNITTPFSDPWIDKYIFPGGSLPTTKALSQAAESLFINEDMHNFGTYYDKTLLAWEANFVKAWPMLKEHYDERFYRMWRYYLLSCAGAFRARDIQLWQIVFSPKGVKEGYQSVR